LQFSGTFFRIMDLNKLFADGLKTRANLRVCELNAGGWKEHLVNADALQGPSVKSYVYDRLTGWTWCVSMPESDFLSSVAQARENRVPPDFIPTAAFDMIARIADGKVPAPLDDGRTWEEQLGNLLALYAGCTQSWRVLEQRGEWHTGQNHFMVVCYRRAGDRDGVLRPAALRYTADVMSVDVLRGFLAQIEQADRAAHPERFA
jgi:hypothetical protein